MSTGQSLSIREIYSLSTGKLSANTQAPSNKQVQERKIANKRGGKEFKHQTKRGHYTDEDIMRSKMIPGPGVYDIKGKWPAKQAINPHFADKKTYIEELIRSNKRENKPPPGAYEVNSQQKSQQSGGLKKNIYASDRISYLDEVQYEAATRAPGVGSYNPRRRARTQGDGSMGNSRMKPKDWIKKHKQEEIKEKQPKKLAEIGSYNPQPSEYTLFANLAKAKNNPYTISKVQRFKLPKEGSGLSPQRYNVVQQWRGKESKSMSRHGLEVLSKPSSYSNMYYK